MTADFFLMMPWSNNEHNFLDGFFCCYVFRFSGTQEQYETVCDHRSLYQGCFIVFFEIDKCKEGGHARRPKYMLHLGHTIGIYFGMI